PKSIVLGRRVMGNVLPFNLGPYRKLGRYAAAVGRALRRTSRMPANMSVDSWLQQLERPLWSALRGLRILQGAGGALVNNERPQGIRLDCFELAPVGSTVARCTACSYVMSEAVLDVCLRCGQTTEQVEPSVLRNYYRRSATYVLPDFPFDDPYPL